MSSPPTDSDSGSSRLDELAEEFAQRCQRGERPALSEYTSRFPELAEQIRELFPALALLQQVRPEPGAATGPYEASPSPPLERLGDYRILREVGRGGMGIVYEAEQESLGRHVALKVLPAHALLDAGRLERFRCEARAAARLHHTNIVPVYGVGEQAGLHYYVMQFIQGQALDQVLDELRELRQGGPPPTATEPGGRKKDASAVAHSLLTGAFASQGTASREPQSPASGPDAPGASPADSAGRLPGTSSPSGLSESGRGYWQSVARLGIQAAEALSYAHGQGTLHRDVKPSNLLLDTHGTVWVTDFGLAKAQDGVDLTSTGDLVGTLRYMAPERFAGKSDARGDVYALGLTLYELLTLRPAFGESDRSKLIAQVQHAEPPRPRKLDPAVPRDLETVVLKATAKDPGHRYPGAVELAEDLRRFAEDKPIRARPVSGAERLWRWCRRNPLVAGLTAAVAALLVAVAVVSSVMAWSLAAANTDLTEARNDAEENARKAREAGDEAEKQASQAKGALKQADARLARLYVRDAAHALDRGDLFGSLPWLVEALKIEQKDPFRAESHRIRLHAVLQQCPRVQILYHDGPITQATFSPDGSRVATLGGSQWDEARKTWRNSEARLWDVNSGRFIPLPHKDTLHLTFASFSSDGRRLVTDGTFEDAPDDGEAQVWDTATGRPLGPAFAHLNAPFPPDFASDGRRVVGRRRPERKALAAHAATTVSLLDARLGLGPILTTSLLACARSGFERVFELRVWDMVSGRAVTPPLQVEGGWIMDWRFSPDGRRVWTRAGVWNATEERDEAVEQLWDAATGQRRTPALKRGRPSLYSWFQFSSDGNHLLSTNSSDGRWWLWEATTGRTIWSGGKGESAGEPFASLETLFLESDAPRLLAVDPSRGVQIWDVTTRLRIGERLPQKVNATFAVSRNGRRVATIASNAGRRGDDVRVWDMETGRPLSPPLPHDMPVYTATFSPDGSRLLTTGWPPGEARVWDVASGRPTTPRLPFEGGVNLAAFGPDGRRILGVQADGTARLYDLAPRRSAGLPWQQGLAGRHPALSPDGRRAVTATPQGVQVWDTATGRPARPPFRLNPDKPNPPSYNKVGLESFSPDGRLILAVGARGPKAVEARVLDAETGRPRTPLLQSGESFLQGSFSPDARRVVLVGQGHPEGSGGEVQVWDVSSGRLACPPIKGQNVLQATFSPPDGRYLATASYNGSVRVWDLATGKVLGPDFAGRQQSGTLTFSPDGRRLAFSSPSRINQARVRIWEVATARPLTPPLEHPGIINQVTFSHDGLRVATACEGGTARVWDADTGQPVTPPLPHEGYVRPVEFSPDGRRLLTATEGSLRVWDAATGELLTPPLRPGAAVSPAAYLSYPTLVGEDSEWGWPRGGKVVESAFTADERQVLALNEAHQVQVWDLSLEECPLQDLEGLMHLLSGRRIDPSGASVPTALREESYKRLKAAYPDAFTASAEDGRAWERAEAGGRAWARANEAALHGDLGQKYAAQDRLDEALIELARATELDSDSVRAWTGLALIRLARSDVPGYRQARAGMVKCFSKTKDADTAHVLAWNCGLAPATVAELQPVVALAERVAAKHPDNHFLATARGLLLYRLGRFEEAVKQQKEAIAKSPDKEGRWADWIILALSHCRLGHADEAKQWLAKAGRYKDETGDWRERLELQILRREAEALIDGKAQDFKK